MLTQMGKIDVRVGGLNQVVALLQPLHDKAGIQFRVVMGIDGYDVVLAGPPAAK